MFVLVLNEVFIACAVNGPGSMHDSFIAKFCSVYNMLRTMYERTGGRVVVDSAIAYGQSVFMIKSAQGKQERKKHVM